ncbi:DUF1501 domain-containing protein [Kamptonema cortianum]|nr:DUF1501 domain-containing protein [Geitlerinema splendidum]MDK3157678.1 DUF1501 domain-containing protein [Kamptonema cortianum]
MKDHPLDARQDALRTLTRRNLLRNTSYGIGGLALGSLLSDSLASSLRGDDLPIDLTFPMKPRSPHFPGKVKNVIFLFMAGAPSQIDLFDPKPKLVQHNGEFCPDELIEGERFAFIKGKPKLLGSPHSFKKCGESGIEISDLLPHTQTIADDICLIRSLSTSQFNHAPAQLFLNSGHQVPGRPSMGSWLTYGLGSQNQDLPGFVVLISGQNQPDGGKSCWSSGFLPTHFQGVELRSKGDPVLFATNPDGISQEVRRESLDILARLNKLKYEESKDPEITTRIAQYELAYRMQTSVPELIDIEGESAETHALYGTDPGNISFANNCLLARRLVQRGVRFIQLYHRGWDHHGEAQSTDLNTGLPKLCRETDQASAALIKDLKRHGLLDETLVIWGGEFGRTPMNEERNGSKFLGRDHHPRAFSMWLAGGGVRPGHIHGATDELGYNITEGTMDIHDLHATILHQMGLDHTRLTYKFQGRDFRLTDVHGHVNRDILL